jgi:tetratricopeptide (TPR) repeat protein
MTYQCSMKLYLLIGMVLGMPHLFASEFTEKLKELRKAEDHAAIEQFLKESRESQQDNPDYYAMASNYWWERASQVVISTAPSKPGGISMRDVDSDKETGSIQSSGDLSPQLRKNAKAMAAEGFKRFPHRMDLGLGLAWTQLRSGDPADAVATLKKVLKESSERPKTLKWMENASLPEPAAKFIPEAIQGYTSDLFGRGTDKADALCKELCLATTEAYPNHPYAYNVMAGLADAKGNKEEALKHLKTAHAKAPQDALVLANLADFLRAAGKVGEATDAYRKLLKLKIDPELQTHAQESLKALEKAVDKK